MQKRYVCVFLLLALLLGGCRSSLPSTGPAESPLGRPDPSQSPLATPARASRLSEKDQEAVLGAVRDFLSQHLDIYAGGVSELQAQEIRPLDERSVVWRGWVMPGSCALVRYPVDLSAVRTEDGWQLFDPEDRLVGLGVAWATAWSGSHEGEATAVPTSPNKRVVSLTPTAMADLLQGLLDEPDNHLVRATAGFYICMTDAGGFGSLAGEDLSKIQSLIPQARQLLAAKP